MLSSVKKRLAALPVRPEERRRVDLSFLYFFCLLSSYYVLRPARDEMSVRAGVGKMPWLFTGTFVAMLLIVPVFGFVASRIARNRFVPAIQLFFAGNLVAFFFALGSSAASAWAGPVFFVWLAVFSVFSISVSWSLMSDLYRREEARRLFGIVAAGGSLGALAGPAAAALAAPRIGPERLLLVAAALLGVCAVAARALRPDSAVERTEPTDVPMGGGALAGVARTLRSPFLLAVALALFCYTMLSTVLYFAQTEVVGATIRGAGERTALFARMDLTVNALALLLQIFVTAPVIRRVGVGGALAAVAGLVTLGFVGLGLAPVLATVVVLQIVHRAGHFALGRPARETLFVSLDAEARYKAKGFIDTVVFRGCDAFAAWLLAALRAGGAGLAEMAWLSIPVGVAWTATSLWLGRRWDRLGSRVPRGADSAPGGPAERSVA
jgi:ATP:ADP antiporter, AAA family